MLSLIRKIAKWILALIGATRKTSSFGKNYSSSASFVCHRKNSTARGADPLRFHVEEGAGEASADFAVFRGGGGVGHEEGLGWGLLKSRSWRDGVLAIRDQLG
jgi:hypothetical protein